MNILNSALLGLIQGLTEFLPVSSSGHLVLAQKLLGLDEPGALLETILHLGTTLAIIVYFRSRLTKMLKNYALLILVASIPAAIIGLVFRLYLESLFENTFIVGIALIITGILNSLVDKAQARREKINYIDSVVIGVAQAIAIIPGISRSGSTIFAGSYLGIDRKKAAEFSLLISIPVIAGANLLQLLTHGSESNLPFISYTSGFVVAFISGLIAIGLLMRFLVEKRFKYFSFYAITLGVIALLVL